MADTEPRLATLLTELQVHGVVDPAVPGNQGRRGGAGPSDHRALTIDGTTVMVPVYNARSQASPYQLHSEADGSLSLAQGIPPCWPRSRSRPNQLFMA